MSLIFGFNYDFKIKSHQHFPAFNEVLVEGRLIVRSGAFTIIKEQFGSHVFTNDTTSVGNAYKSAATEAFKKCASEIGLCWDIYTQEKPEVKPKTSEEEYNDKKIV